MLNHKNLQKIVVGRGCRPSSCTTVYFAASLTESCTCDIAGVETSQRQSSIWKISLNMRIMMQRIRISLNCGMYPALLGCVGNCDETKWIFGYWCGGMVELSVAHWTCDWKMVGLIPAQHSSSSSSSSSLKFLEWPKQQRHHEGLWLRDGRFDSSAALLCSNHWTCDWEMVGLTPVQHCCAVIIGLVIERW